MTDLNVTRHISLFDPYAFGDKIVDVVGCGATGSRIAMELAKLGVKRLRIWDFDQIEDHNVSNQGFGLNDVGQKKIDALAHRIKIDTGLVCQVCNQRVDGDQSMGNVVFVLTDTMASRDEIWKKALKLHPSVERVIETRMGADQGRVYSIDPMDLAHIESYEKTLYSDDVSVESVCGTRLTVGSTAAVLAGKAIWAFINWFKSTTEKPKYPLDNEVIFGLNPFSIYTRTFNK